MANSVSYTGTDVKDFLGAPVVTGRSPLDRERVLQAALDLVDREGVSALTMRALAADLAVEAPSLYKHVPNKDAILDGICELIYGEIDVATAGDAWQDRLHAYATGFRSALLRHRNAATLVATRPVTTDGSMLLVEAALGEFAEVGFDPETSLHILNIVVATVIGLVLSELSEPEQRRADFADPDRFPLASSTLVTQPVDRDAEFELAIDMLTTSITARIPTT